MKSKYTLTTKYQNIPASEIIKGYHESLDESIQTLLDLLPEDAPLPNTHEGLKDHLLFILREQFAVSKYHDVHLEVYILNEIETMIAFARSYYSQSPMQTISQSVQEVAEVSGKSPIEIYRELVEAIESGKTDSVPDSKDAILSLLYEMKRAHIH